MFILCFGNLAFANDSCFDECHCGKKLNVEIRIIFVKVQKIFVNIVFNEVIPFAFDQLRTVSCL